MYVIPYPVIDPVLIQFGPLAIRWYSLAYVAGILIGWRYMVYLSRRSVGVVEAEDIDDFVVWATLGTVIGGRLGYVLFYQPAYFLQHPLEIPAMWQGGMSFHGGATGVIVAIVLFCRRRGIALLPFFDLAAAVTPIGLFFGRIANFINGELFGRVTDVPWAMVFPRGGPVPRHPSQLYEAALEGIALFALLCLLVFVFRALRRPGVVAGAFLLGYALARISVEFVREPDPQLGLLGGFITMGQLLSIPVGIAGLWLLAAARGRTLGDLIRYSIRRYGPIAVSDYMGRALGDPDYGYYRTGHPIGRSGDFITAPEMTQAFGEIIGLWCATCWQQYGSPPAVNLVELGPGRGTLLSDALRAANNVPGFTSALRLHLVDSSRALREAQRRALVGLDATWHDSLASVPEGPMLLIANEFFDALPADQYVRAADGWRMRQVDTGPGSGFGFVEGPLLDSAEAAETIPASLADAEPGALFECSRAAIDCAGEIGRRIQRDGLAALIVDYGHARPGLGETLQAVKGHHYHNALTDPGAADLTVHVDFSALARSARRAGCAVHGPVPQGAFLIALGIQERTERLAADATPEQAELLRSACARLTGSDRMGTLFKVVALTRKNALPPAGFEAVTRSVEQ